MRVVASDLRKRTTIVKFFLGNAKDMRLGMFLIICRVIVVAPIPWIMKAIIDQNVASQNPDGILIFLMLALGLLLLHYSLGVSGIKNLAGITAGMIRDLRTIVFNRMQLLSLNYLDKNSNGKLIAKYSADTLKVQDTLIIMSEKVIPDMFYGLATLVVLICLNAQLSILVLFFIPVYFALRFYFWNQLKGSHESVRASQEDLTGKASELISGLRFLKSLGELSSAESRLQNDNNTLAVANREMLGTKTVFWTTMYVVSQCLSLIIVGGGAYLVIQGSMSIGTLVAYLSALPVLLLPMDTLTLFSDFYYRGEVSYQSLRELTRQEHAETWKGTKTLPKMRGEIHFDNIDFAYPSKPNETIFNGFSLKIKEGEKIALVGASGSGKTTLTNLVLGLYDVQNGSVRVDGVPLSQLDMNWFRKQCSIVMQDTILFSGSIMDNLRFANLDATDEQIKQAARDANAEEFINRYPEGYNTIIGERGQGLSGGQRQRISIARALLRNPKILLLDEATSALDNDSEEMIQEALRNIAQNRTVITVAHRLSTVRNADRIVVLGNGKIIEEGSFEELAALKGYFKRLIETQAPMFINMYNDAQAASEV